MSALALLVAWQVLPTSGEILENIVHLALEGHLAHASPENDREVNDPEHGCSDTFHLCSCHTSTPFIVVARGPKPEPQQATALSQAQPYAGRRADGYPTQPYRPPTL